MKQTKQKKENKSYDVKITDNGRVEINNVEMNETLFNEQMVDYDLRFREDLIDDLINWASETKSDNDKQLMKDDIKYLMSLDDTYIFSSINTNEYIAKSDDEKTFNEICEEIIKINVKLNSKLKLKKDEIKTYEITETITNTYKVKATNEDEAFENLGKWKCEVLSENKTYDIEEISLEEK